MFETEPVGSLECFVDRGDGVVAVRLVMLNSLAASHDFGGDAAI